MPLISRERLFHQRLVKDKLSTFQPTDLAARRGRLASWAERLHRGELKHKNEGQLDRYFIEDLFGHVLGYRLYNTAHQGEYHCEAQQRVTASGTADAMLGRFYTDQARAADGFDMVPIEVKDGKDDLDLPPNAKGRSPVQQLFDYLNGAGPHARFGVLTNFAEIRLYSKDMGWGRYEVFRTDQLYSDEAELKRFIYLLGPERMLWQNRDTPPPAVKLLSEGEVKEQQITKQLYSSYKQRRETLFNELKAVNKDISDAVLLEKTQKVMDRVLFILFAEDRGLLPPDVYGTQMRREVIGMGYWEKFNSLCRALDEGENGIPQYNGKLFAPDAVLDGLRLPTKSSGADFTELARFDFETDVNVRILGHILEQSISDLEAKKADLFHKVKLEQGRRKRDGVYYTPAFITKAIVAKCVDEWLAARRSEIETRLPGDELAQLLALRDALNAVTVLDPACGSGAFLVAALDHLTRLQLDLDARIKSLAPEHALTPAELGLEQSALIPNGNGKVHSTQDFDFALTRRVLVSNIYGVDINAESVDITKLSLWLQTAQRGFLLPELDKNIRVGDSLIPEKAVSPQGFNWQTEFPQIMDRGGFDIIIGNPPYVKLQTFRRLMPQAAEYLRANYHSCKSGNFDLYLPFIERGLELLHPQGWMGYIAPSLWLKNDYGRGLKELVKERRCLRHWVDFGWQQVFEDAITYTALQYFGRVGSERFGFDLARLVLDDQKLPTAFVFADGSYINYSALAEPEDSWNLINGVFAEVISAMGEASYRLDSVSGGIHVGLQTSANPLYHFKKISSGWYINGLNEKVQIDDGLLRPLLGGEELERYAEPRSEVFILFPYRENNGSWSLIPWANLPAHTRSYFSNHEQLLRQRESGKFDHDGWYMLYPKNIDKQHLPKLCVAQTIQHLEVTYDQTGACSIDNVRVNGIIADQAGEYDLWYVLGVLNSLACDWYFRFFAAPKSHGYFEANKQYIAPLPVPRATPKQQQPVIQLAQRLTALHTKRRDVQTRFLHEVQRDLLPAGSQPSRALQSWHAAGFDFNTLRTEAKKVRGKTDKETGRKADKLWDMPLFERNDWDDRLKQARAEHEKLTGQINAAEQEINQLVYALYGLTSEQVAVIEAGHPLDI